MAANNSIVCIIVILFIFIETSWSSTSVNHGVDEPPLPALGPAKVPTDYCESYNGTDCDPSEGDCVDREHCGFHDPDKRNHCFVLWQNTTEGKVTIKMKGCFMNTLTCYDRLGCVEEDRSPKKDLMFCCCEGNMCNRNFTWNPSAPKPPTLVQISPDTTNSQDSMYMALIYTMVPLTVLTTTLIVGFLIYRHKKMNLFNELPTAEPSISCPPSPQGTEEGCPLPVILREVKARGRFGAVWRGQLNQQEVAVKVFPVQDKHSWLSEQEIFKLPRMNHPDILQYIGVDKQGDNLQAEYWLVTAYHEKGSLCDYLKAHTLTWLEACRIAVTMSRGLTHLHDEVAGGIGGNFKPAIAHRDFKSKNVLLKRDMSACIADFGLALVFQPGKPCGDTHGQVGTRRYMAPEVLEGAINFTRDAFLRIDMYACGLVLWEIASRCLATEDTKADYLLPFEEEIGSHPTLEEMQDAVVLRKVRPRIGDSWKNHNGLSVLCDTMEECWDHDAEARLSASCVLERISCHTRSAPLISMAYSDTPLLIENAAPIIQMDSH